MDNVQRFTQAYTQAPWRKQLQVAGTFLLVVVSVAIVALLYLNITTQAAAIGREIQSMQVRMSGFHYLTADPHAPPLPIEELVQHISDLEVQLAQLTSYEAMEGRAKDLDLKVTAPEDTLYIEVPGYVVEQSAVMAPAPVLTVVSASGISPAFKESLIDWLEEQILSTARLFKEVQR